MINAKLANKIWILLQSRESKNFHKNCFQLKHSQNIKLKKYLSQNKNTQFGTKHKFDQIKDYNGYKKNVPIQEWNDINPWVELIKNGNGNVLTSEKIILFEETSGTSSFSKLIPYTNLLKKEIQKGVGPWMNALHKNHKSAFKGSSYWSISPPLKGKKKISAGIPIGIEDDTDYFNPFSKFLLSKILAVPTTLKKELHSETFYFQTFEYLLMRDNLSFISVWSPTFFLQLDDFLSIYKVQLVCSLKKKIGSNNKRLLYLEKIITTSYTWKNIWPDLSVLSCWCDAQSSLWVEKVQVAIGDVYIQGKGLLSTEGICSVPLLKDRSPVLSVSSHFYEFRALDSEEVYLANELKDNEIYEIIMTTGGGLYRYASGDLIQIDGFYGQAPTFKFLGRKNSSSDLVGEKLTEFQVSIALQAALKNISTKVEVAFIYPVIDEFNKLHYRIYIEAKKNFKPEITKLLSTIEQHIENTLIRNPYYKTAIDLNQLSSIKAHLLENDFKSKLFNFYINNFKIKDGNLKMPVLFKKDSLNSLLHL
tara:strand:- start:5462 stop:7060 length:1599 start_codon:yes stop_codon:yes gene_type:complete